MKIKEKEPMIFRDLPVGKIFGFTQGVTLYKKISETHAKLLSDNLGYINSFIDSDFPLRNKWGHTWYKGELEDPPLEEERWKFCSKDPV